MSTKYHSLALLVTTMLFGLLAAIEPALAHHFMGGAVPSTNMQGLLSGLGHPVIGLDHLAFIIAIGLLSAVRRPLGIVAPGAFVIATVLGTGLHLAGLTIPLAEMAIAVSVIAAGAMLITRAAYGSAAILAAFAGISGLFHGYAYGESIFGAESTPLLAYLAGFCIIQLAIGMLAYAIGARFMNRKSAYLGQVLRISGVAISILGFGFLIGTA